MCSIFKRNVTRRLGEFFVLFKCYVLLLLLKFIAETISDWVTTTTRIRWHVGEWKISMQVVIWLMDKG